MTNIRYRYGLDTTSKKFDCPQCHKKRFVRYMDFDKNEYLPEEVGRCDRQNGCGYWLTSKNYFKAKGINYNSFHSTIKAIKEKPIEYIPFHFIQKSISLDAKNNFIHYLKEQFGFDITIQLILKYFIGTSKHQFSNKDFPNYISEKGASVFWQVDDLGKVRYGKVMLFNQNTGRRIKEPFSHITAAYSLIPDLKKMKYEQVFFGQHLIVKYPKKVIAIFESEKTAIIASIFFPDLVCVATGGKTGVKLKDYNLYKILMDRNVIMFPDFGKADNSGKTPYDSWCEIAKHISERIVCNIKVNRTLEDKMNPLDRDKDYDLVDWLIKRDNEKGIALTDNNHPVI